MFWESRFHYIGHILETIYMNLKNTLKGCLYSDSISTHLSVSLHFIAIICIIIILIKQIKVYSVLFFFRLLVLKNKLILCHYPAPKLQNQSVLRPLKKEIKK